MPRKEDCYRIEDLECPNCDANIRYCSYKHAILIEDCDDCDDCIINGLSLKLNGETLERGGLKNGSD